MNNRRLRILFLTKWYPNRYDPQMGVFVSKHAAAVAKFCDVALLHVYSDDQLGGKKIEIVPKQEAGFTSVVVYFRKFKSPVSVISKMMNLVRYCRATLTGLNYIRKNFGDHDITHAYILLRPAWVAFLIKLFYHKPFIISEQWSGFATGRFAEKGWLEKFITRFLTRKADRLTVVSNFLKNNMIGNGLAGNYAIIPNVIESPPVNTTSRGDNKIRILVVADLIDEIKNISGTLKAFREVSESNSNLELHIIGDGKDRSILETLARELNLLNRNVFFLGLKPNTEVYRNLVECDFVVMNSNFETFSLICAEAISCGKPVLATRCGGPEEFVTGETGMLVHPGDHGELVNAMLKMTKEYKAFSPETLKTYAHKMFSAELAGEKFYTVYASVLRI